MDKFHFLGINGSGIVGVACLAKEKGFDVDGCDLTNKSDYSRQLSDLNIDVGVGQSRDHLDGVNVLVVSPAIFFKDKHKTMEEIIEAKRRNIKIIRWQQFLDKYLAKGKKLIGVCGTHGKTTTTALVANLLESCGADPCAIIGGINKRWDRNYRNGSGKYFVCESDEYGYNFTYYHPKYILINNIEMEHPEFFSNLIEYKQNFCNFVKNIRRGGAIVFNADDRNVLDVIDSCLDILKRKNVKLLSYSIDRNYRNDNVHNYHIEIEDNFFVLDGVKYYHANGLRSIFNVRNMSMAVVLMKELGFNTALISEFSKNCDIAKRRMEKIFDSEKVVLYDDYAHHHTQVRSNLYGLRQNIGEREKIVAVLEPHLISRFTNNSEAYIDAMSIADYSIITKFFKSREEHLEDPNMNLFLSGTGISYDADFDAVAAKIASLVSTLGYDRLHIVIMGAGLSYKLSKKIKDFLQKDFFYKENRLCAYTS
ncbi:MAG: Mur ligase domain-containing protein [Rickettsiales bacterium]|nr:Mur ligase domain-containing protein [Rickettsiales bacterium]